MVNGFFWLCVPLMQRKMHKNARMDLYMPGSCGSSDGLGKPAILLENIQNWRQGYKGGGEDVQSTRGYMTNKNLPPVLRVY